MEKCREAELTNEEKDNLNTTALVDTLTDIPGTHKGNQKKEENHTCKSQVPLEEDKLPIERKRAITSVNA